jgi:hypothetical protein
MAHGASLPQDGLAAHPIDVLLLEIARAAPGAATTPRLSGPALVRAVDAAGGQDVVNLTAAIVTVAREHGTVLGPVPADRLADVWTLAVCHRLADVWTLAVCHRLALSLKYAFTSRDPSGATWRRFVAAWERAHLELSGYFRTHPRAFGEGGPGP